MNTLTTVFDPHH